MASNRNWKLPVSGPPGTAPGARGRIARWFARILGAIIAAFTLFMLIAHAVASVVADHEPLTATGAGVGVISMGVAASLLAGWRWETPGGVSCLVSGIVLGIFVFFTAGRNEIMVALALGAPIIVTGIAFLVASRAGAGPHSNGS